MIQLPPVSMLQPKSLMLSSGVRLHVFRSASTPLVKLDLLFEAGSAYQPQPLCSSAACRLLTVATKGMTSAEVSHYLDFRGIIIEHQPEVLQSVITVYMLRRYADEMVPMLADMVRDCAFSDNDFRTWQGKRRTELATYEGRTSYQARKLFYQSLLGTNHPLGVYATTADADCLEPDMVRRYARERYCVGPREIVVSGSVDDTLIKILEVNFQAGQDNQSTLNTLSALNTPSVQSKHMENSTQTTVRLGRVLPLRWDDMDYAQFMLLTTALGGYFGSRLMSNLREDKGYTYGIYARTQLFRGLVVFFVTADVTGGMVDEAQHEILAEMERLCVEPMPNEELQMVKSSFVGDFLRSVDGIFELSTRFCDMHATNVDERLTGNIQKALHSATPDGLRRIAELYLKPGDMTVCRAGV